MNFMTWDNRGHVSQLNCARCSNKIKVAVPDATNVSLLKSTQVAQQYGC